VRRACLLALTAALVAAAPAAAGLPFLPSGSSVGEGTPLKAYATVSPPVHLFGDSVTARLAVVADTKWVDPTRLHVSTSFKPYHVLRGPTVLRLSVGRFEQVTWTWTLSCLTQHCVPQLPPSDKYHVFHFRPVRIDYFGTNGKPKYGITASWPPIEVLSQVSPGVVAFLARTNHLNWRFHMTPVASPTYRLSPRLVFWLALGLAAVLLLVAALLSRRWYRTIRPPAVPEVAIGPTATTLERALALLAWAHARGDETLERKAIERVADELVLEQPRPDVDELSRAARELAWSPDVPADEEVETFSERARETGGPAEAEEVRE
jgi:hypothetical protein